MTVLDMEEKQQVDQVKTWFKEYGMTVLVTLVVVVGSFLVWQRYLQMHERATAHASLRYDRLLDAMAAKDAAATELSANYLIERYPHSTYAMLATLLLARNATEAGQYPQALQQLQHVMDTSNVPTLQAIARLRYARLEIDMKQPAAALTTLQKIESDDYLAPAAEIKGDAFYAMHNLAAAKQAYQAALSVLPDSAMNRSLLQMKYNNIAAVS